jgi:NADH:ubiquinone oxidoreductase subunit K
VVGLQHWLVLASVLFCIGLYGAITRRNSIAILMCVEIMLNAANVAFVAFSRYVTPAALTGQAFAIFIMVVAAAEAAVALAIIMTIYRTRQTVDADKIDLMKG